MSVPKPPAYMPGGDAATGPSDSTLSTGLTTKRSKTRKPPSVRTKEHVGKENRLPGPLLNSHTPPIISTSTRHARPERDGLQLIVDDFQSAIQTQNWDELDNLIEHYSHAGLHFGIGDAQNHPALKKMREESAIQVLTANSAISDQQMNAALDLLSMGADWNARDKNGASVLNILRKNMTNEVLTLITEEYPSFKHLFIDREGRRIAPKS